MVERIRGERNTLFMLQRGSKGSSIMPPLCREVEAFQTGDEKTSRVAIVITPGTRMCVYWTLYNIYFLHIVFHIYIYILTGEMLCY